MSIASQYVRAAVKPPEPAVAGVAVPLVGVGAITPTEITESVSIERNVAAATVTISESVEVKVL